MAVKVAGRRKVGVSFSMDIDVYQQVLDKAMMEQRSFSDVCNNYVRLGLIYSKILDEQDKDLIKKSEEAKLSEEAIREQAKKAIGV